MEVHLIGEQPPASFIKYLEERGVPLSIGRVIIAGWEPHQNVILQAIKAFGLEHQVIFNKGAVMILPPGVNKASGAQLALKMLNLSPHNAVAVGDAENDCAMFMAVECAVAVQNAVPHVRELADWTTSLPAGQGVCELIDRLLEDDLASLDYLLSRHLLPFGEQPDGSSFGINPFCSNVLLAGSSGCGKTTLCAAFLEKITVKQYQYCLIDPEGDYSDIAGALIMGDSNQAPTIDQVLHFLANPEENAVVCIVAIPIEARPKYFSKLLRELIALRERTGHPHFIVLDEAHHLIPKQNTSAYGHILDEFNNFLAITTNPELLNTEVLRRVNIGMAMGEAPAAQLTYLISCSAGSLSISPGLSLKNGEVLVWEKTNNQTLLIQGYSPRKLLMRHK
jgi:gluconate kinase